jgi:circadian clock protein KaiC
MLMRLIDFLKAQQITALFTSLTHGGSALEQSEAGVSSLIDTWLLMRDIELGGERNRGMYVLKSRGMAHSNQIREFLLTDHGVELKDVYVGPDGVLTGSLRLAQEARERAAARGRQEEIERRQRDLERKRRALEAQVAAQRGQFEAEEEELELLIAQERAAAERVRQSQEEMARSRKADEPVANSGNRSRRIAPQGGRK